jgi:hypothetical protein
MSIQQDYDRDFYAWALRNAELLKMGRFSEVDIKHLVEELEDVGKSERRALESHIRNLLLHLLKWQYQPHLRGSSWRQSIRNARIAVDKIVRESPSLKPFITQAILDEYPNAKADAVDETGLRDDMFPPICPYREAQALNPDFWPDSSDNPKP